MFKYTCTHPSFGPTESKLREELDKIFGVLTRNHYGTRTRIHRGSPEAESAVRYSHCPLRQDNVLRKHNSYPNGFAIIEMAEKF